MNMHRTRGRRFSLLVVSGRRHDARGPPQAPVELTFYYPVAVGRPRDPRSSTGSRRDFPEGEPRHQGSSRSTRGRTRRPSSKVLTALKSGEPPADCRLLLSTDMFTLIDEDAIIPSTRRRRARRTRPG